MHKFDFVNDLRPTTLAAVIVDLRDSGSDPELLEHAEDTLVAIVGNEEADEMIAVESASA